MRHNWLGRRYNSPTLIRFFGGKHVSSTIGIDYRPDCLSYDQSRLLVGQLRDARTDRYCRDCTRPNCATGDRGCYTDTGAGPRHTHTHSPDGYANWIRPRRLHPKRTVYCGCFHPRWDCAGPQLDLCENVACEEQRHVHLGRLSTDFCDGRSARWPGGRRCE